MSDLLSEPQFSILTKPLLWSILKRTAATAGSSLEFSSPFPPKKIKKNIDRKARVCKTLITGSNPVDASQKAARKGSFFIVYGVVAVQASTLAWARQRVCKTKRCTQRRSRVQIPSTPLKKLLVRAVFLLSMASWPCKRVRLLGQGKWRQAYLLSKTKRCTQRRSRVQIPSTPLRQVLKRTCFYLWR